MNPIIRDERRNSISVLSKNSCFKDNVKNIHWVAHLQLRSLDTDYFLKRTPVVDNIQDSVTVNKTKQSVYRKILIHIYYKNKKKCI